MRFGMDFSTLEEIERLGGAFYENGRRGDLVAILRENGITEARLRLWNDPFDENGNPYGAGTNDLACVLRLAKRAKDAGMRILLDLHYSDFWCDPSRQCMPKAWRGLSLSDLGGAIYDYTFFVLKEMAAAGVGPETVQTGNEITNGMLWPLGRLPDGAARKASYRNLAYLLDCAGKAVRDAGSARVMLHLERSGDNACYREWFDAITAYGVRFDDIGMSYYPFWHGRMDVLLANMRDMAARYDKDIYVVETAYPFTGAHYDAADATGARLIINDSLKMADGSCPPYPFTKEGQRAFVRELIETVQKVPGGRGKGVCYWEPAWLPLAGSSWATGAALAYIGEADKPTGNEWANQCIFDYAGNANPALAEFRRAAENA